MKIQPECIPCQLRQVREAIALSGVDSEHALDALRDVMRLLDWNVPSPTLAQQVHRRVRQVTHNPAPYAAVKERLTQLANRLYPMWSRSFHEAHPPLEAAVRLAIVGNLLDVGPKLRLDDEAVTAVFHEAITAPLWGNIEPLRDSIAGARSVLYLADNAGEIIFDRDLLALLPKADCTFAVRGHPVLNDATIAEAEHASLPDFCKIISTGSDAPGTHR